MLCGMALNMPMLIVARILQGAGGGGMQPLAQSILLESFPPEQHGKAMAAYGVGIVVAPVIGPTLGGWITDSYSWRWIFYINLPVGLLALFMANLFIEDPPYLRHARRVAIDGMGFALMAVWLGALQLVLDKGQEADWFEATWIRWVTALSVAAFLGFVARELLCRDPIVQLHALLDHNFRTGTLITGLFGVLLYGVTAFLPLFLQTLLGYSAMDSGLAVSPRGLGSMVAMVVVGVLINRFDSRALLAVGLAHLRRLHAHVEPHQPGHLDGRRGVAEFLEWLWRRFCFCTAHHARHGPPAQAGDGQRRRHLQPGPQHRRQHRHRRPHRQSGARRANPPELHGRQPHREQPGCPQCHSGAHSPVPGRRRRMRFWRIARRWARCTAACSSKPRFWPTQTTSACSAISRWVCIPLVLLMARPRQAAQGRSRSRG